jgi:murein L,D-transpeptidase YcbB/YkuD
VPIIIAYFTAWVDESAQLYFRDDVYDYDQQAGIESRQCIQQVLSTEVDVPGKIFFLTAKSMF